MFISFLFDEKPFLNWSIAHIAPILIFLSITFILIKYAKTQLNRLGQKKLLLLLCLFPFFGWLLAIVMKCLQGQLTIREDLPIYICRIMAITAPLVYWKENKFWTGVFYFWIIVGTANALLTPDLKFTAFHWQYLGYFLMHAGLLSLPLYYIFVLGHSVKRKDLWNAFMMANALLVFTMVLNYFIGSNYMYTKHKPEVPSLLDSMGPWPWYLVSTQILALFLFSLAFIPFLLRKKISKS